MKKKLFLIVGLLGVFLTSTASIKVKVAPELGLDSISARGQLLSEYLSANRQNPGKIESGRFPIKNGETVVDLPIKGFAAYQVYSPNSAMECFLSPEENLLVEFKSDGTVTVSGTRLMDDIMQFKGLLEPIEQDYRILQSQGKDNDRDSVMEIARRFEETSAKFYKEHSDSPAAAYALLEVEGEDFLNLSGGMSEEARKSPFYPMVQLKEQMVKTQIEKERLRAELSSGNVMASDFKLPDLSGKMVSIADFRGKWVVLDFWGAWCKWCIKGFPELKKAYGNYEGKLEVIGVDNRDTVEEWKAAVERFKLPWVNVYNGKNDDSGILQKYMVEGFPTKVIISPEGKIVDITVGEDPSFFERLAAFIGE